MAISLYISFLCCHFHGYQSRNYELEYTSKNISGTESACGKEATFTITIAHFLNYLLNDISVNLSKDYPIHLESPGNEKETASHDSQWQNKLCSPVKIMDQGASSKQPLLFPRNPLPLLFLRQSLKSSKKTLQNYIAIYLFIYSTSRFQQIRSLLELVKCKWIPTNNKVLGI